MDTAALIDPAARDTVVVSGADAHSYLQSQLAQDITDQPVGEQRWTLVLEPTGKITALARITRTSEDTFELDTDAGWGEALADRIRRFMIRVDATVEIRSADAPEPSPAHETARVTAGWPRMGREIEPGATIPATTGLVPIAVSVTKGCYPGQELVERMDSRGADAPRTLRIVEADADVAPGDAITDADGNDVGAITSVAPGARVALGYVKRGADVGTPPAHLSA